ncbi:hypothetical protein [Occallatibacter riparius]|uniref:Uncharacterized protein n=1 Tax=Occallatibacter riparius TaxID=1002689 RepID=A0A9J7BPE1_9BACT|nr:hypothetical protein [Occallatibacter riparius]UWZ84748.1 hypothetical protein MOP44_02150 [Occallatibacter riparius]
MHSVRVGMAALAALLLPLLVPGQAKSAQTKAPSLVSNSQITIRGDGPQAQTISLTAVRGDWFVSGDDAHANLDFETGSGPHYIVQLQWDGAGKTHTITHDTNDTVVGTGHSTFYLMLPGENGNSRAAAPHDSDVVAITITHMDDSSLEAHLSGTATAEGKVSFDGALSVRRTGAHAVASTGAWHDCDPQIHDKMVGAEARSPSECEVKFDQHVRQELQHAFAPLMARLEQGDWVVSKQPQMGPVQAMARHSEKSPYHLDSASHGAFHIELGLKQESAEYQQRAAAYQQAMEKMNQQVSEAMKNGGPATGQKTMDELARSVAAQMDNMSVKISVGINAGSIGVVNFAGTHNTASLPGGGTVVYIPAAQPSTGGGPDSGEAVTWVLVGPWKQVTAKSLGSDGEHIDANGGLLPGKPTLAVQNVWVRIRAGKDMTEQVIQKVDWDKVRALIQEN